MEKHRKKKKGKEEKKLEHFWTQHKEKRKKNEHFLGKIEVHRL